MKQDVLAFAAEQVSEGKSVALITVTETSGSSPATPGQMIAVLADGTSVGTVGGGASEHRIIKQAVDEIQKNSSVFKISFDLAENGMICGGSVAGFGNILGTGTGLCIFGGGHIAQDLALIAKQTGFYVTIVEDRPELASFFDGVNYVICETTEFRKKDPAEASDYAVICTRGHKYDEGALRYCLTKDFKYLGMIGSKNKVKTLFSKLHEEGMPEEAIGRIFAPIGLDIADAAPAEIAVAILAEILLIKNDGKLRHKRESLY